MIMQLNLPGSMPALLGDYKMKRISLLISAFTILLDADSSYAFNWKKCERTWIDKSSWMGEGLFTSTTSFFSSTGACAMIGKSDHDAKVFIAHNKEKMLEDFARGGGEYAYAFASLYSCDPISQQLFLISVKEKYIDLLKLQENEEVFGFLKKEISNLEGSGGRCKREIHSG